MGQDLAEYLNPDSGSKEGDREVAELAREVAGTASTRAQAAVRLFEFVRDSIAYSPYVPFWDLDHYRPVEVLRRGSGYCVQKSALLCALARAVNIPARLSFADVENHLVGEKLFNYLGTNLMTFHCMAELCLAGRWLKATPSFERPLCRARGWRLTEFDGVHDALLPARDLSGRPHITYLRYHFTSAQVPLKELLAAWNKVYGRERVERWRAELEKASP